MQEPRTRREAEVWEACDQLYQEQGKTTGDAIREKLASLNYNKGSFTEIYKYRATWMKDRKVVDLKNRPPGEASLPDPILRIATSLREQLQSEAEKRIQEIQAETETALQEADIRYNESRKELGGLQKTFDKLLTEHTELQLTLQKTQEIYQAQCQAHAAVQERAKHFEAQYLIVREDLNNAIQRFEKDLQQKDEQHQQIVDQLRESQEQQRHKIIVELDAVKTAKLETEKQFHSLQQSCKKIQTDYEKLKENYQNCIEELKQSKAHAQHYNQQFQESIKNIGLLEKDLSYAKQQSQEWRNLYQESQQSLLKQQAQLGHLEQKLEYLRSKKSKITK